MNKLTLHSHDPNPKLLARLNALKEYSMDDLKAQYKALFGEATGLKHHSRLLAVISYRLQELEYGGLSEKTQRYLQRLAQGEPIKQPKLPKRSESLPPIGTELIRSYKGVDYHLTVRLDGFEFQGQVYSSLSKIAHLITGTRWNGYVFWGLKKSKTP